METLSIVVMNWRDIRNPDAGGAEVFTHEVARRWVSAGHEVTLLTSGYTDGAVKEDIDGVHVIRRGSRFTVYRRARQTYLESYQGRTDVVVDEINTIPFFTPKYVRDGTRLFALIHQLAREGWFYETPLPIAIVGRYLLEDRWLRLYTRVPTFAVSESTSRDLKALGFERVFIAPEGSTPAPKTALPEKEPTPTLLFVGRLKKYKLPDHAISAFGVVREQIPDARLWIVGDGYLRKRLERSCPQGVTFFGHVPEATKLKLMERAHVLLFPSVREGWGLGVTEANAFGVPAVGYDVPGLRDSIRNGVTGRLVAASDAQAMGQAALELLTDERLLHQMARTALAWARGLSWQKTADTMLGHFEGTA